MKRPTGTDFKQCLVFLASPGDVNRERKYVESIVADLNRSIAKSKGIFLQTRRWELDTFPQAGSDVQGIINAQIADMAQCELFIGIMWNRIGQKTKRAISGTVEEYDRAFKAYRQNGQPEIWMYFRDTKLTKPTDDQLRQLEQVNVFKKQSQIKGLTSNYETPNGFKELLRNHLILWLETIATKKNSRSTTLFRINPYKLYYFRQTRKLSYTKLAVAASIDRTLLRRLENVNTNTSKTMLSVEMFSKVDGPTLAALEDTLDCHGKLTGGQQDDFLSQYLLFYDTYKSIGVKSTLSAKNSLQQDLKFKTRAVVFDFGGTLSKSQAKYTTWERLWKKIGYTVNDCSELHHRYQRGIITHQEWCDCTYEAFRERGLTEAHLIEEAKNIELVSGVANTIIDLRKRGIRLYIVSGSLKPIIIKALGELYQEFEEIRANDITFDSSGVISKIFSTPYDFRGKADFLRRIIGELNISPLDVLFVGNSCNDVFASESGVRTLCVNPRFTDPDKQEHWTYSLREMTDFSDVLKYIY